MPRISATSTCHKDSSGGGPRARVPAEIREYLGAGLGDTLVFEEENMHSAERAALKGKYCIVRIERPAQVDVKPESVESFIEVVNRRL